MTSGVGTGNDILDSSTPVPLYYQIYLQLKRQILSGEIPYGGLVRSETELSKDLGVSRITSKRALDELAVDNLIVRQRGRGTFVTYCAEPVAGERSLAAVFDRLSGISKSSQTVVLSLERLIPSSDVAAEMKLSADVAVHFIRRLRLDENDVPFAYYESWSCGLPKAITAADIVNNRRYAVFEKNGHIIHRVEQAISCCAISSPKIAELLRVVMGDPLLTLERTAHTQTGEVLDLLRCHYHPERFQYRTSFGGDHSTTATVPIDWKA